MKNSFVYDDGGRKEAGYPRSARGDCVPRAIAIALGLPYKEVLTDLHNLGKIYGASHPTQGTLPSVYRPYLKAKGWIFVPAKKKLRFRQDNLPKRKRVIVSVPRHLAAVIDGELRDTWESSKEGEVLINGFYVKK